MRDDISGPGTWAFLPAKLASGETVVINTGFVQNTMQDRAFEDRASPAASSPARRSTCQAISVIPSRRAG